MQHSEFGVTTEISSATSAVLRARGDLDAHGCKLLDAAFEDLIQSGRVHLVCELSEVRYMSSAGASLLIRIDDEAHKAGGELTILNASDSVRFILETLGLISGLELRDDARIPGEKQAPTEA